jgi:succinoglycan biosynthesis transport protein ExoP
MSDAIELRGLVQRVRRRWWVPAGLAIAGVVLGVAVSDQVSPVHRAQGTLLVGPINGTVTKSTTLRASESLATFYADLARRQVVLDPVVDTLRLSRSWAELRNHVSAVIPDRNPRAVTVTVTDANEQRAAQVTAAIIKQLIALSPAPSGQTEQGFVSEQVASLRATIKQAEARIDQLQASLPQQTDAKQREALTQQLSEREALLNEWRHTYVELMALDPTSDAGGLQLLDDVSPVTSLDRAGTARQGVLGGVVGAVLGLLIVWRRFTLGPRRTVPAGVTDEQVDPEGWDAFVTTAARQDVSRPSEARLAGRAT